MPSLLNFHINKDGSKNAHLHSKFANKAVPTNDMFFYVVTEKIFLQWVKCDHYTLDTLHIVTALCQEISDYKNQIKILFELSFPLNELGETEFAKTD
jgi:hypothetical protein